MADSFKIVASLDIDKSAKLIKDDIPKLQEYIKNEKIEITAGLNLSKSQSLIQAQLNTIANQAQAPTIHVGMDLGNSQSAVQGATNGLKTVQEQAKQTASAVKQVGQELSVNITDTSINKINKAFHVSSKATDEYRNNLKALATELSTAWNTYDEDKYYQTLRKIIDLIGQFQVKHKAISTSSSDYSSLMEQIATLEKSIGYRLKDSERFIIDPKFRSELEYVTGGFEKLEKILNSVFGRKWTFNTNLSGTNLRNFLDTQSVGIAELNTNYGKYAESQYGGANQARYFVETYEKLMELKSQAKATISDFDAMWDSITSPEDEQFFIKNIENVIAEILKLNNYTQRNNDPFGWFEPIIDDINSASQSISTLTSNISVLQNTASNSSSANSKNYFSNSIDILKNIQNFKEEENAVKTLEQTFKNLGATVTSVERKKSNGFLTSFTTEVKASTGEIEKFSYAWKNINAGTNSTTEDWRYVLTNIESSDKAVQRLIDSQKKYQSQVEATATSLKAQLNTIQSGYTDKNSAKYISNTSNQTALANQYKVVESAIEKLKTADQNTFASMKANAEAEITTLKNMVKQFQNAEYAATSLRTKDINTNKSIQTQELDKFISKISSSKPILDAMTGDISQLKALLNNITDATSFTKYLNELDIAKAKFESLKALYQSIGGYDKQLDNLAKSWQKQGIYVGNVQTTVENLKKSLANVTTADGLTTWVNDFKSQIGAISELPIKIAEYRQQISATSQEWYSQGILVGEIQTKMTSLARGLPKIKTQAGFEKWVTQWTELNQQATLLKSNLDRQVESQNNIYAIQTKIAGLNPTKDTAEIERLNKKLAVEQQTLANIQSEATLYTDLLSKEQQEQYITEQTAVSREKLTSALNASAVSYKNEITSAISTLQGLQNKSVFRTNASDPQVTQTKQDIQSLIGEYNNLMSVLETDKSPAALETVRTKLGELGVKLNQATTSAKQFETELRNDNGAEKLAQRVALLKAQLEALAKANPKALKRFGNEINSLMATLNNSPDGKAVDQVAKSVQLLRKEINNAGLAGKTFFQRLKDDAKKFTGWMSMTYVISMFTREVRQAITELKNIDTILTEISKTSDRTEESLRRLGATSFETASKYGQKASDYLTGVQEMSRAGFGEKESEQMAELSTLAQSAGDMTADLANEYLIATNAGYQFGGSTEKLTAVLNSQNYITNRNALNMSELAEATKIVSSQSAQAGIGIDEMTAAVGTMIATTQQGGEVAARAFRGILMNLQSVKSTADEIGDGGEDITDESLTKYEKACADLGVSLKEVKDGVLQLRDPMVILEELANAVSKEAEGSIKVANLVSAVGGKYRGGQLLALLRNWETYSKMLAEYNSQEAENSAFDEAMKTANSWEGKLNELSNSWTEFINGIVDSSTAKSVIDFLNSIIKGIDSIRDGIGTLPTILGSIALGTAFKNVGELLNTPSYALLQLCA